MIKHLFSKIILFFFVILTFSLPCKATDQNITSQILDEEYEKINNDIGDIKNNLPKNVQQDLDEIGVDSIDEDTIKNFDISKIFKVILSKAANLIKSPLVIFLNCIAIILIVSLFNNLKPATSLSSLNSVLGILTQICTCGVIIAPIIGCISSVCETIKNFGNFMMCFIPVFTGAVAMSSGMIRGIGYNSTIFFLAQIISYITADFLMPITGSFLALSISGSINESFNISGITSAVKKVVIFTLSLLLTLFIGIFTIQSSIASSADTIGMKTAKFLSSSFIPIIGSSLADALSFIFGGLNIIKSTVGGFGIIVCIITFLPPILTVGFFIIFTALSQEISKALNIKTMEKTLGAIKDCLSILLAFLISYAILIISTTSIIITMGAK